MSDFLLSAFGQAGFELWHDPHTSCFGGLDPLTNAEIRVTDAIDGASVPECDTDGYLVVLWFEGEPVKEAAFTDHRAAIAFAVECEAYAAAHFAPNN